MFDPAEFTPISREDLFQALVEREAKRVKSEQTKERARETARLHRARAESDVEDERAPWEYQPKNPLQPIEETEIISAEDSEGHALLTEDEEELILEED